MTEEGVTVNRGSEVLSSHTPYSGFKETKFPFPSFLEMKLLSIVNIYFFVEPCNIRKQIIIIIHTKLRYCTLFKAIISVFCVI